jgi:hypothetical protein
LGTFSLDGPKLLPTVDDALRDWYATYLPTFSASYAQACEVNIRRHLVPAFGSLRLNEVEERHLLDFVRAKTELADRPLAASPLGTSCRCWAECWRSPWIAAPSRGIRAPTWRESSAR